MIPINSSAFVLIPAYNTIGLKDASGAFQPEAKAFVATLGLASHTRIFDNNRAMADRAAEVGVALQRVQGADLKVFAAFCHGWRDGVQFGYRVKDAPKLAEQIAACCDKAVTVVLYCCDTGQGQDASEDDTKQGPGGSGGFASKLFVELHKRGLTDARVYGHSTTGHTTKNPYVRLWREDADMYNGDWIVDPSSELFSKWRKALAEKPAFRFRFPFMSPEQIRAELQG